MYVQYIPRSLTKFYNKWEAGKTIKLCCSGEKWIVKANTSGKRARLGKGWSKFTEDNGLGIGDRLHFKFINEAQILFQVNVVKPIK